MTYLYKPLTSPQIEAHLAGARHAVVGTVAKDGGPHLNTVWFLWENGRCYLSFFNWGNKLGNLLRDRRICVCVPTAFGDGERQVILYGTVGEFDMLKQGEEGYDEALDYRMTQKYSATEVLARTTQAGDAQDGPWMQISFTPDKIIGDNYDGR